MLCMQKSKAVIRQQKRFGKSLCSKCFSWFGFPYIFRFCDRIALFEEGRLAECASHDELMALGGKYAEMFNVQAQYYREHPEGAESGVTEDA